MKNNSYPLNKYVILFDKFEGTLFIFILFELKLKPNRIFAFEDG